jgi:hypothetical protein
MVNPDEALATLQQVKTDFSQFCEMKGNVSEADTRAKIIDKVLTQVLGWPERAIQRERHVHEGYLDYELEVHTKSLITIEAKKVGTPFIFPIQQTVHRSLKLSGSILTISEIDEAISQVRKYCDNEGIRYAVATNGYAWIIFRAIREDMGWRKGSAVVFPSLEYIIENFTLFWNLLSHEAVLTGSLDTEFGSNLRVSREGHRVINILFNADLPLQRNRLNTQLQPLVKRIFEDITGDNQLEILQSCYVHHGSLTIVARDIDATITDTIPMFLKREGAEPILQSAEGTGRFGEMVTAATGSTNGELCLLLGGIGSGKTTFLRRYQLDVGRDTLAKHSLWFHIDCLKAPLAPEATELFVWQTILEQLRSRYGSYRLEKRRNIRRAYKEDLEALEETALKPFKQGSIRYEEKLAEYLGNWQSDTADYVPRLLNTCEPRKNQKLVIFIDNVDQLPPESQAKAFLLAQRVTRSVGSLTVVAMREESYYTASVRKSFTAYTNRRFHIASPRFLDVILNRITYAQGFLKNSIQNPSLGYSQNEMQYAKDIYDLLTAVSQSLFEFNHNIIRFIEAICFGNMRSALEMFVAFLTSGATDVDKMINIYRRDGKYYVGFHEFVKSIMLAARKYYKEEQSPILNVFDCGTYKNSSHFTALRILHLLLSYRAQASREGQGYIEISGVLSSFEDIFDNTEDFIVTLNRLLRAQLVEVNTRSTESITDASHVRVTSAGWYYSRYLVQSFCYLDLVLQDTPFNSRQLAEDFKQSVYAVDNLYDREEDKVERVEARFNRVEAFLDYLKHEEDQERTRLQLDTAAGILVQPIVEPIREQYETEREWIRKRIRENRERYADEPTFETLEEDAPEINRLTRTERANPPKEERPGERTDAE